MIQVYSATHPTEAHIVKGLLEAEGIECEVRGDILFGARGELPLTPETAPSVWIVDSNRYTSARSIIALYEQRNIDTEVPENKWTCSVCQEEHGDQFSHCWKCGSSKLMYP